MKPESASQTFWPWALLQATVCWAAYLFGDGNRIGFMVTLGALVAAFPIFSMVTIDSPVLKGYIRADDIPLRLSLGLCAVAWLVLVVFPGFPQQYKLGFLVSAVLSTMGTTSAIWLENFRPKQVSL